MRVIALIVDAGDRVMRQLVLLRSVKSKSATHTMLTIVSALFVLLALGQANAETGNSLLDDCKSEGSFRSGVCSGFVVGVAQVVGASDVDGVQACFPEGVTKGQLRKVVVAYLEANPGLLHYDAATLVIVALVGKFPC